MNDSTEVWLIVRLYCVNLSDSAHTERKREEKILITVGFYCPKLSI